MPVRPKPILTPPRWSLLAALIVSPLAAAETGMRGTLELGIADADVDHRNALYGEYSGIADDRTYWLGRLDLGLRQEARYLDVHAADLGLDSRSMRLSAGEYGSYSIELEHSEIPHLLAVDARSPYDGVGTTRLTLPDDFTPARTTSGMGGLGQDLKTFDLKNERDINRFQVSTRFADHWLASFSLRREDKDGLDALGGAVGQNGARVASVILPRPIDYRTDEIQGSLSYDRDGRQLEFGYLLSIFKDGDSELTWDVPYLRDPVAGLYDYPSVARIGLEPDNRYQRLSLSGGLDFLQTARLSAYLEAGRMRQNDALLPYSTDDIGGTAAVREDTSALPRTTAEAAIDIIHAGLDLSANPLPRLGLVARYRFEQTDNLMPYTLFDRVVDDTAPQSNPTTDDAYSRPYDWSKWQTELAASYGFAGGLHLRTGWRHEEVNYDPYHEVPHTAEDTLNLRLRKQVADWLSASAGMSDADRRADDYSAFRSFSTYFGGTGCPNYVTVVDPDTGLPRQVDTCFVNHPDVRKYMMASRRQHKADLGLNFTPSDAVDIGLSLSRTRERYDDQPHFDDTFLGLRSTRGSAATLDFGFSPGDDWSLHAYYTRERYGSDQNGRAFINTPQSAIDSGLDWSADFDDGIDTLGLGGQIKLLEDRLVLALDCTYDRETSRVRFSTGSELTAQDLPEDRANRQSVRLDGTYELGEALRLRLGVEYERYRSRDWSLDGIEAGGVAIDQVLPLYGPQPGYDAWLFTASVIYDWR